jgi:Flp pilus assembly protein TadG
MKLLGSRRGTVTVMTAILAVPLLAMTGLAVDLARVWLVKSRLQMALDAGVLVAARSMAGGGTSADGVALFWANFARNSRTTNAGYLAAVATTPVVTQPGAGLVKMASQATLTPTLLGVIGIGPITVQGEATAESAAYGLELALVLDNTGSMAGSSITSLISSSTQLLNIIYGGSDTQPNLWVSVVPFSSVVNIGKTHTGWLVGGSVNQTPFAPSAWMGCVMARTAQTGAQAGDDANDKTPAQAAFTPYRYASTYHAYAVTYGTGQKSTYYYPGDNDWTVSPNNITEPTAGNGSVGPNLGCPALPILPETASKAAVMAVINKMVPVYRGGTFINLGLQAGWWTLSPNWKGLWGTPTLPLAYHTPYMKKVIVLMTDGNNEWYDWPDGVPGQTPPTAPPKGVPGWSNDGDADFTGYGRLKSNTLGLNASQSSITSTLNTWMSQMCTTIKQNGIVIYTIVFNKSSSVATQTLFRNCASSPGNYFLSPSGSDLQTAFTQIGQQLSSLRLAQ